MSLVPIDWTAMLRSLDRAARRVADLLRSAPDGDAKVAGLDWTVSELGAHLINEAGRFERFARGKSEPLGDVAQYNADEIATITERNPAKQADTFLAEHAKYMDFAKQHDGNEASVWFEVELELAEAAGIYLGELSVHAVDIARTIGSKVKIPREDALLVAAGLVTILPGFVDPEATLGFFGSYTLKLRGGPSIVLRFTDGTLVVEAKNGERTDCTINADPEAFLLVGYGRLPQYKPIVTGKLIAAGRKPWLGLKFGSLLVNP